jgi:hypothetical protein
MEAGAYGSAATTVESPMFIIRMSFPLAAAGIGEFVEPS